MDTGLRLKFFITIFIVLGLTATSVSAIHYHFFKLERLRLMELNLQQNASLLANSELNLTQREFSDFGEEFIQEIIGDDKINMIVAIYNSKGKNLYKNDNAYIFELPDNISTEFATWEEKEHKDFLIKYLTQKDSKNNRIIKVGMILNQSMIRWKDLNQRVSLFVAIILLVIIIVSFILSYILFKPVQTLADQVTLMAKKIEEGEYLELKSWFTKLRTKNYQNDEFNSLISSLDKLATQIMETQKSTQQWSALMAHELKTPMTLLKMSLDELITSTHISPESIKPVEAELKTLENIIMDFLEWASVENDSSKPELHVIHLASRVKHNVQQLEKLSDNIKIEFVNLNEDARVFCNPIHFDQIINNIITNAIKYGNGLIRIECSENSLKIWDNGPGIPNHVLENFGKPFNKFKQKSAGGYGLGLAWVNTIAKKYNWKIHFNNSKGSLVEIHFSQT